MKVSIRDLSRMTGYSPATISNALNHKKGVNKETAEETVYFCVYTSRGYCFAFLAFNECFCFGTVNLGDEIVEASKFIDVCSCRMCIVELSQGYFVEAQG